MPKAYKNHLDALSAVMVDRIPPKELAELLLAGGERCARAPGGRPAACSRREVAGGWPKSGVTLACKIGQTSALETTKPGPDPSVLFGPHV